MTVLLRCMRIVVALLLLFGGFAGPAQAHKPSDSYLSLAASGEHVDGQWDIALRDLEFALGLDADDDGAITWGEVRAKHDEIAAYALARLTLKSGGHDCPLVAREHLIDSHSDGAYAVLRFTATCAAPIRALETTYRLFFDLDRQHKGLLRFVAGGATSTGVFSPERSTLTMQVGATSAWSQFADYVREGIWHIWIGLDHILFLTSLLLPAVVVWTLGQWAPVPRLRPALIEVLKIVTAFTLAHSITLSLATLGVIELPSRLVESTIALSVVAAALNNLSPQVQRGRWAVAFGFGLIHGFGFASVLADLGLPSDTLVLALVGFNVGVEIGQIAIVAAFLPVAFGIRRSTFYRVGIVRGGSALIALIAAAWFAERAFDLKFMPF